MLNNSSQRNDRALLKKITYQMNILSILGDNLREPHSKFLKGYKYPLLELRPIPERIFYAAWKKDHYILLHHYTKKTDKTSRKEIEKAIANLDDWLSRKESEMY
jgi:phage-related protein